MQDYFFKNKSYYRTNDIKPDRPTLFFIHGLSASCSAWFAYEKIFQDVYNIISIDLRGHGKSYKYTHYHDYDMQYFVEDIKELLEHLSISKCVLVSNSLSTLIVFEFLAKYPDYVSGLVLLGASVNVHKGFGPTLLYPFLYLINILRIFPFHPKAGYHLDYDKYLGTGDWNLRRLGADVKNTTLRIYFYVTRQSYSINQESLLPHIHVPTLIIAGEQDSIFPIQNSIHIHEKIKNSELIILPQADHVIVINKVKEISEAMQKFLGENTSVL